LHFNLSLNYPSHKISTYIQYYFLQYGLYWVVNLTSLCCITVLCLTAAHSAYMVNGRLVYSKRSMANIHFFLYYIFQSFGRVFRVLFEWVFWVFTVTNYVRRIIVIFITNLCTGLTTCVLFIFERTWDFPRQHLSRLVITRLHNRI